MDNEHGAASAAEPNLRPRCPCAPTAGHLARDPTAWHLEPNAATVAVLGLLDFGWMDSTELHRNSGAEPGVREPRRSSALAEGTGWWLTAASMFGDDPSRGNWFGAIGFTRFVWSGNDPICRWRPGGRRSIPSRSPIAGRKWDHRGLESTCSHSGIASQGRVSASGDGIHNAATFDTAVAGMADALLDVAEGTICSWDRT